MAPAHESKSNEDIAQIFRMAPPGRSNNKKDGAAGKRSSDESRDAKALPIGQVDAAGKTDPNAIRIRLEVGPEAPYRQREAEVLRVAEDAFSQTGRWIFFLRTMLGTDGVVAHLFPESQDRERFNQSAAHSELHEMIAAMRSSDRSKPRSVEPERMITLRIPTTIHEMLTAEGLAAGLSMNQLAIGKLIQPLQSRHTPEPQGEIRGRRPGPRPTTDS